MRRIQSSCHHHSLSFILLCRGLIIQHPLLVRDALPIASIPKAPTDGDCLERLPAAIPSPKSRTRSPELRRREEREDLTTKYTREQAPRQSREEISVKIRQRKGQKRFTQDFENLRCAPNTRWRRSSLVPLRVDLSSLYPSLPAGVFSLERLALHMIFP